MIFIILIDMELFEILNKDIPQRQKIYFRFQKKSSGNLSKFLLQILKKTQKNFNNLEILNQFFIELYDILYQYIIFDKIKITKKLVRLLEELALPMNYIGKDKRKQSFKKIKKMKL